MWEFLLKIFSVYLSSMVKFIFGSVGGLAAGLNMVVTMVITVAGMMTVVISLAYFSSFIRKRILLRLFPRKPKSARERTPGKWKALAQKYGIAGVAFFTPIILTPIGGTLLAIGMGTTRQKIILFMLFSAALWSFLLTLAVYFGADILVKWAEYFSTIW